MERKPSPEKEISQAFVINDKGEEIPITDEMVQRSMRDAKLQSIGTHTGYHKVITDDMLEKSKG
ncbi:hypothetical protein NBRC116494_11280 [Aurantivibrio plasticivorans]